MRNPIHDGPPLDLGPCYTPKLKTRWFDYIIAAVVVAVGLVMAWCVLVVGMIALGG